jgi:U3 small nucleolar ribonucleoprotein protein IMP3
MVRKLAHHESRLLRHVSLHQYPTTSSSTPVSAPVLRRYAIARPSDYTSYNRICGSLRQLAARLAKLPPDDPVRRRLESELLGKLWDIGILGHVASSGDPSGGGGRGKLSDVEKKVTVSAFARRRLGVVMTRLRMGDTVQAANRFVQQGHVRVGTEVVTDESFLVTR